MSSDKHGDHLLGAEQARRDLTADWRNMNSAGKTLIRRGEHNLKTSAFTHGIAMLGGLVIGVALGRLAASRQGRVVVGSVVNRAAIALTTSLVTHLYSAFVHKRSSSRMA